MWLKLILVGLSLVAGGFATAAPIRFDFGDGSVDVNTGVAANFVVPAVSLSPQSNAVDGVTLTLEGMTTTPPGGVYTPNSQGFGIETSGESGNGGQRSRIGATEDGETVHFSFDTDVFLISLRLGNVNGADEGVALAFLSGDDPFAGGSFTYTTADSGATEGPTYDIPLGSIFVTAGTLLEFRSLNDASGGVLWNDLVVSTEPVPEPATASLLLLAAIGACFPARRAAHQSQNR
ncbi:glycoside hydrolase family 28 protein [Pirellulimonas nuda]|nr:hypothetical protein [Pirellulimonas nuda]